MGEKKLRDKELFEALSNTEIKTALDFAIDNSILLVGKCDDGAMALVKPQKEDSTFTEINGILKSSSRIATPQNTIFSFVVEDKKYLFHSKLTVQPNKKACIQPLGRVYTIQRRANERLIIPDDFYALFKFSHINSRYLRTFGKLKDLSVGGLAVVLRSEDPSIKIGDHIKGSITLIGKPPEDFEFKVKHKRTGVDGPTPLQIFGGAFHPEGSLLYVRRMNAILSDIYNDMFKSTKINEDK